MEAEPALSSDSTPQRGPSGSLLPDGLDGAEERDEMSVRTPHVPAPLNAT